MQSARLELNLQPIHLNNLVEDAVELLRPSITAREQIIDIVVDDNLHPLMVDEQRIERVIANLVSNAHKYSPKGGLIRIEIKREQEDQVIRVIDQGPEINEDEIDAVFSPYYRGKLADSSPVQGSGLGLSIARYLTELHDGTLTIATSTPEGGSTFVLRLPASSLDLLDDELTEAPSQVGEQFGESLWPQDITQPSDRAFTK
jgi:signal transduction histidine kinase